MDDAGDLHAVAAGAEPSPLHRRVAFWILGVAAVALVLGIEVALIAMPEPGGVSMRPAIEAGNRP